MTEQEMNEFREFFSNNPLFVSSNFEQVGNHVYAKSGVLQQIKDQYPQLDVNVDVKYTLVDIAKTVWKEEKKRQAAASNHAEAANSTSGENKADTQDPDQKDKVNRVVAFLRDVIPEYKKSDYGFVASELLKLGYPESEVLFGIVQAGKDGIILNPKKVVDSYEKQLKREHLLPTAEGYVDQQNFGALGKAFFESYTTRVIDYQDIDYLFKELEESGHALTLEQQKDVRTHFVAELANELTSKYEKTKLRGAVLANELYHEYGDIGLPFCYQILLANSNDDNRYALEFSYQKAYERYGKNEVINTLREIEASGYSEQEAAQTLINTKWPAKMVLETVKNVGPTTISLDVDSVINEYLEAIGYGNANHAEQSQNTAGAQENADVQENVGDENNQMGDEPDFEQNGYGDPNLNSGMGRSRRRKYHIVSREQAKSSIDKKAVVACMIAAAGCLSTTVLVSIFGVNPLVAAKNCFASLAAVKAANIGLSQLLPNMKDFVALAASVSTTIFGTISWLRLDRKKKQIEAQEALDLAEGGTKRV